jgi:hypothetical protein
MLDKASRLAPQDPWTTSVRVFLNDGLHSPSFTGSCCEFRVQLKASPKIAKAKLQPPTGVPSYDGHLHYPEYNLLVDSNFSAIDLVTASTQSSSAQDLQDWKTVLPNTTFEGVRAFVSC